MLFSRLSSFFFFLHNYVIEIIHFCKYTTIVDQSDSTISITSSLSMAICISVLKALNLSVCHILVFDKAESNTIKPFVNLPIISKNREHKRLP